MATLILMRHGQSAWNEKNLFTGWVDVPLSMKGIQESMDGGLLIREEPIDLIFTSTLIRAQMTAMIAMAVHSSGKTPVLVHESAPEKKEWGAIHNSRIEKETIPVIQAWELNERMYGDLQGMNKKEVAEKYGDEQVKIWRRSFDVPPPGNGESLKMTANRTIPFFKKEILPLLHQGKNIFVAAHGNSLRSVIMELDQLSPEEVVNLELDTGRPIIYHF